MIIQVQLYPAPGSGAAFPRLPFSAVTGCAVGSCAHRRQRPRRSLRPTIRQSLIVAAPPRSGPAQWCGPETTIANIAFGVSGTLALAAVSLAIITRWRRGPPPKVAAWHRDEPPGPFNFDSTAGPGCNSVWVGWMFGNSSQLLCIALLFITSCGR